MAVSEVTVIGTLPSGDTTSSVTYFIIDRAKNAIVGQVVLPNASNQHNSVSMTVKVPSAGGPHDIGTFDDAGNFRAAEFLRVVGAVGGERAGSVSGSIPEGPTTANVNYFVVERSANAIVGNITLPNASTFARTFRLDVQVANLSGDLDVGLFDGSGTFVPAGFTVEVPSFPTGAVGPRG
jgi:hypothetical protein